MAQCACQRNPKWIPDSCGLVGRLQQPSGQGLKTGFCCDVNRFRPKCYQLLSNEFNNMKALSNQYVAARQSLDYIAPNALANDRLNQKIIDCGHALAAMAANGQFVDDGSCQ